MLFLVYNHLICGSFSETFFHIISFLSISFGNPPNNTYLPLSFCCTKFGHANFLELYVEMYDGIIPKISYIDLVIIELYLNSIPTVQTLFEFNSGSSIITLVTPKSL